MNRFDAVRAVREAVEQSNEITEKQKRRIKAALVFRPRVRREIIGLVTQECVVEGMVTEDGAEAVVEWIIIVAYVAQLIAAIIKIVEYFWSGRQ